MHITHFHSQPSICTYSVCHEKKKKFEDWNHWIFTQPSGLLQRISLVGRYPGINELKRFFFFFFFSEVHL